MTIAKITAGDGYLYLTRTTARGDSGPGADPGGEHDATAYYTAGGNPSGRWAGRGAHLLGLENREVTEDHMRALFGYGMHPDAEAMIDSYLSGHATAAMTDRQLHDLEVEAIRHATLGRRFPEYEVLGKYDARVSQRLRIIADETGRDPTPAEISKIQASEARRQRAAVAGFDLVCSPVKSAALLWAVDDRPHVRDAIRRAHENATQQALDLIEDHAAYTRTGTGGIAQIKTNGLITAQFEHWDSRAGDPNLHTHVAVSSKVQGADGKWRSLDARALYRITVAASECYNTAFETHLTALLGVTFTPRPDTAGGREPVREIDGVPPAMIGYFSRRRAAIEARYAELLRAYRRDHGHDPSAAVTHQLARQANLDTRAGKKPPGTLDAKRAAWREELTGRFGADAVTRLMQAVPATVPAIPPPCAPDLPSLAERTVASVSARRSSWTIWNVRAEAERLLRAECTALTPESHRELAEQVTALALSPAHSISVEAPAMLDEPPELRRADGESVFTEHAAGRYTSQAVLDAEQRLLDATRTPTLNGLAGPAVAAVADGFEAVSGTALDPGQRALVTAFATDDRLLLAGIGPAGAGKTTAMRAYAHVLRQSGRRLIPLATSAASADVLGRELSLPAENLHKFLHEWTAGRAAGRLRAGGPVPSSLRQFTLHPGDVVLVDEAGMAGTFLLDQLVSIAASRGATVRLLGDHRQLSAVESGGALRLIAAQPGAPELTVLHRFRDAQEGEQTLRIRSGDVSAVDWYAAHGRVRGGSREAMAQAAYAGWKADMLAGKTTMMAAGDGRDVTELSAQARADRVAAGQVEADGVVLRDGTLAGAGDWIVTRHNDRRLSARGGRDWVKNGDAWHVEHRHDDGSLTVRSMGHRGRVRLPSAYVAAHVQLLYATTAHRVQGATVDTAHPLITAGLSREVLYVLASRAREKTVFYVATHDLPFDEDARVDRVRYDPRAYAAREVLINVVSTEGAALSATETITVTQDQAASLATLVPRYLHAAHQHADSRYRAAAVTVFGDDGAAELTGDPAWGAVVRRLYDAETSGGWEPAVLLAVARDTRELATAESIAEVMSWRIDSILAGNPQPPRGDAAYESAAAAKSRLGDVAERVLGTRYGSRARSEKAFAALIAALRRAENDGHDAAGLLTEVGGTHELRTARSISEVLTWRIARRITPGPGEAPGTPAPAANQDQKVLPWLAPTLARDTTAGTAMTAYLNDTATLISTRVSELAERAVRDHPAWISMLGPQPGAAEDGEQWLRHASVIAAYRDQHQVTSDDPRQVLGPYPEPGHAGDTAYWHAAESVLAARRLAGIDRPAPHPASNGTHTHMATDIYQALPPGERVAIASAIAADAGPLWLGDRVQPDEHAVIQPAYASRLTTILTERGYMDPRLNENPHPSHHGQEAVEASLAWRRNRHPMPGNASLPRDVSQRPDPSQRSSHQQMDVRPQDPTSRDPSRAHVY
jgi:conjugative relaxase-like TrwC/TraI family protein